MKTFIVIALAAAAGIFAFAIAAGLFGSLPASFLLGAVASLLVGFCLRNRPIVDVDESAVSRGLRILSGLATLVALFQLARATVFMVAPAHTGYSTIPSSGWELRHSCLTSYFVAAGAAGRGQDVYDLTLYNAPDDPGVGPRKARMIGPFAVDAYHYPPPFLLLPRATTMLAPDFPRVRALWFGFTGEVLLLAMVLGARSMGPGASTRALLLLPLVWVGIPMMSTLQKGNAQPVVIAFSMLAMVLFERRRSAAGGALLAYAALAKLYPGMLGVYLLARRQWSAAAWTAAMGVALIVLTVADVGLSPFAAFLHHLPALLSGEAFPAFRIPAARAINLSIPGLVFKAGLFGVPGMGFGASKVVGWIFTAVVVWVTVQAARRDPGDREKPLVWLAILILATLRSPFLPQTYGVVPALWVLTLLAATYAPTAKTLWLVVVACLALSVDLPPDWPMDPRVRATLNLLPQTATIALAVLALRRRVGPEPSTL